MERSNTKQWKNKRLQNALKPIHGNVGEAVPTFGSCKPSWTMTTKYWLGCDILYDLDKSGYRRRSYLAWSVLIKVEKENNFLDFNIGQKYGQEC